jgi:hypothetical protein
VLGRGRPLGESRAGRGRGRSPRPQGPPFVFARARRNRRASLCPHAPGGGAAAALENSRETPLEFRGFEGGWWVGGSGMRRWARSGMRD